MAFKQTKKNIHFMTQNREWIDRFANYSLDQITNQILQLLFGSKDFYFL